MMYLLRKQDVTRFARNDVVFATNISEATSLGVAVTISETTSFAVRQTSLKKALAFRKCLFHGGGDGCRCERADVISSFGVFGSGKTHQLQHP